MNSGIGTTVFESVYAPPPDTDCYECWLHEATLWHRMRGCQPPSAFGWMVNAMLGQTEYQRHREHYVTTGDLSELERMTRHVRIDDV
jgi:hypothetical protein